MVQLRLRFHHGERLAKFSKSRLVVGAGAFLDGVVLVETLHYEVVPPRASPGSAKSAMDCVCVHVCLYFGTYVRVCMYGSSTMKFCRDSLRAKPFGSLSSGGMVFSSASSCREPSKPLASKVVVQRVSSLEDVQEIQSRARVPSGAW